MRKLKGAKGGKTHWRGGVAYSKAGKVRERGGKRRDERKNK